MTPRINHKCIVHPLHSSCPSSGALCDDDDAYVCTPFGTVPFTPYIPTDIKRLSPSMASSGRTRTTVINASAVQLTPNLFDDDATPTISESTSTMRGRRRKE